MLKYRKFMDLTYDEIKFIINDIFSPVSIPKIVKDPKWNEITVEMVTDSFNPENKSVKMTIKLGLPNSNSDNIQRVVMEGDDPNIRFDVTREDGLKWRQFLLAKGCHYLLRDNPYLE